MAGMMATKCIRDLTHYEVNDFNMYTAHGFNSPHFGVGDKKI